MNFYICINIQFTFLVIKHKIKYNKKNFREKYGEIIMNIFKLLNNDISQLSEEERVLAEDFNEALREKIIDSLVESEIDILIKESKFDEQVFRDKLSDIFINGKKGYKKMPTKTLIDIYLDKRDEGEFINLIESINEI